jgi:hypothetical protein
VLEKELMKEMAETRRKKLTCFQKTSMGVIKKMVPVITTTATDYGNCYIYGNS